MKDKDLLKALLKDGWKPVRVHGSHHIVQKGDNTNIHLKSRQATF